MAEEIDPVSDRRTRPEGEDDPLISPNSFRLKLYMWSGKVKSGWEMRREEDGIASKGRNDCKR